MTRELITEENSICKLLMEDFEKGYDLLLEKIKQSKIKLDLLANMYDTADKFKLELKDKINKQIEIEDDKLRMYVGIKIRNC